MNKEEILDKIKETRDKIEKAKRILIGIDEDLIELFLDIQKENE